MKRKPSFLHVALNMLLVCLWLLVSWTAAFYLTTYIYERVGWAPHDLFGMLVNAVSGFIIFGLGIALIGAFFQPREHYFIIEMIDALRRISRGDFQINLEWEFDKKRQRHPYVQLVNSINDMAANLKEMEELRQEFISNVSHEIGSPLTSISGFAKALKDDNLSREQRQRYLTIIETESVRLSKLSDNLLKLAVLDSDKRPFNKAVYRLDKQLISLILACEPQWEEKQIEMDVETEEVEINADEDLMSQVWVNLIHNGIKFTPPAGKISIAVTRSDDQAIVRIADTSSSASTKRINPEPAQPAAAVSDFPSRIKLQSCTTARLR
jgi:two-component system phosphate regulon sensor histidine kinase PhoR